MPNYFNPLFPIAPPTWLFCYNAVIVRTSQLASDTDENGWPILTGATTAAVKAYLDQPEPRTLGPEGEAIDVIALVPNGTVVDHRDLLDVPDGQSLPSVMPGRFHINQVRPNPSHTRLLCTRVTDPAGAEA
jgi:hypothetical protein